MSDLVVIALILAAMVLLDVTALRFGYDSRDTFRRDTFRDDFQLSESGRVL